MLLIGTYTGMDLLTPLKTPSSQITPSTKSGGVLLSKVIEVRSEQPEKAFSPMAVTELGIVTEVRLTQSEKADSPILVTELGIVTEVRLSHKQKV